MFYVDGVFRDVYVVDLYNIVEQICLSERKLDRPRKKHQN